jgi:hypothetical protein
VEYFRARYDALVIGITAFSVLIMAGVALPVLLLVPQRFSTLTVLFLLAVVLVTYGLSPRGFSLGLDRAAHFHRPFGAHVLLPYDKIRSARALRCATVGSAGCALSVLGRMFGFFGWFWSRKTEPLPRLRHQPERNGLDRSGVALPAQPERSRRLPPLLSQWLPPRRAR